MGLIFDASFSLVVAVLLAALARRVLGFPVGWPRAIVVGLALNSAAIPVVNYILTDAGLVTAAGFTGKPAQAIAYLLVLPAWTFAVGIAALVILEALVPTGRLPTLTSMIRGWGPWRRRSRRYGQIVIIALRHGLGRFLRFGGARRAPADSGLTQTARSLRSALNDAGVTFVKLGQMLSTRRDVIPEEFVAELSLLQTQAEPLTWEVIGPAVEAALGRPTAEVFAEIDPVPLAAASVGQVHAARLVDGRDVVIKVQRPGARQQVDADLDIIVRLARRLERVAPWARSLGVRRLADGFADSLHEELDYTIELENVRNVQAGMAAVPGGIIAVPQVHGSLTSRTLLVMDRLDGVPLSDGGDLLAAFDDEARARIAGRLLSEVLRQILVTGVFHADLHPGNIFIRADGSLALLDFGSVGRLDDPSRTALGLLLMAIDRDDAVAATDALVELLDRPEELSSRELERSIGQLIVRYRTGFAGTGSAGMFGTLLKLINRFSFAVPPQVGAALRALGALEGSVTLISPEIDIVGAARTEGREFIGAAITTDALRSRFEGELLKLLPVLQRLPSRVNKITDDLQSGRLTVNVRALADRRDRDFITTVVNQITMTVIAAAVTVSAAILITSDTGPALATNLSLYAFFGYLLLFVGFVLGLRVLVLIFQDSRERRGG